MNKKYPSHYYVGDIFYLERVTGVEPVFSGWKPDIIATIRYPQLIGDGGFEPPISWSQTRRVNQLR